MSAQPSQHMKSMKLYNQVERIFNELRALGIEENAPLTVDQLTPFDQYHYHGTDALDAGIAAMALGPDARVLEVGSGIGGPARYVANRTGAHVTAMELQPDLDEVARALTGRCDLQERVDHVCGNFLGGAMSGRDFDALMGLLVFLHIPEREKLFDLCARALRPGGRTFIEDFSMRREPSPAQWEDLRVKVKCPSLETPDSYRALLEGAGFVQVVIKDMSASWTDFTVERYALFRAARNRNLEVHGPEVIDGLDEFYRVVSGQYADGVLGGVRINAVRG